KLAVAFRKPLAELPLTPYQVDHEPQDAVELEPNGARVWLGLDTLRPWVDGMVRADEPMSTVGIPLPLIRLERSPPLRIEDAWFTNALVPGLESNEYSWRLVSGRPGQPTWSLYARTLAEPDRRPLPDVGLELDMGAQRRWAVSDQIGRLRFDKLDPADIEPLRFLRAVGESPDRRPT